MCVAVTAADTFLSSFKSVNPFPSSAATRLEGLSFGEERGGRDDGHDEGHGAGGGGDDIDQGRTFLQSPAKKHHGGEDWSGSAATATATATAAVAPSAACAPSVECVPFAACAPSEGTSVARR